MDIIEAIQERRSIRKYSDKSIDADILFELVRLSRLYPSAANRQPIRYGIIAGKQRNDVFQCLRWASFLPDYEILPNQRPTAYIVILTPKNADRFMAFEAGAAASILMLAAKAYSISSCCLGISDETNIQHILNAPQQYEPIVVIALGYGAQESRIVPLQESNRYYRDGNGTLNVPKINIDDVIIYSDIKIG